MNRENNRIEYLDVAKGVLILLLLFWHFGDALKRNGLDDANPYFLPVYIVQPLFYPFFMQAFFILSGYCMKLDVDFKTFLVKNLKTLLLPWIVFELIRVVYCAIMGDFVNSIITRPEYTSLWFLNALFIGKLIVYGLHKMSRNGLIMIVVSLLVLVVGVVLYSARICSNIWFFEHGMVASFLLIVGFLLKKYGKIYNVLLRYSWIVYAAILVLWKLYRFDLPFSTACLNVRLVTIPLYILISIVGTFSLLAVCKIINRNIIFEFYGKNTLIMYGTHMVLYEIVVRIVYQFIAVDNWTSGAIFIISVLVMETLLCATVIKLFNTKRLQYALGKF